MLEFQQIKEQYPEQLQGFQRALLREYLQYKILQAIFESRHASQLAFLGGTALRIVHDNPRFSEDIDLDNFGLSFEDFERIIGVIRRFLELEGLEVETRSVSRGAYRCYLKIPSLLYEQGLSPLAEEKILVQIDTSSQGYSYQPEIKILNKFDVFTEIRITPENILLSQKIYTAITRKRPKGRDFFDITFLLARTKPDYEFLSQMLEVQEPEQLRQRILTETSGYDFSALADDVAPFLIHASEVRRVQKFREFWKQAPL